MVSLILYYDITNVQSDFNYIEMLQTSQSFDFSLGLESNYSPMRNNKSNNTIETAPSLQYSNMSYLQKVSSSKQLNRQFIYPRLQKVQESTINIQTTPRQVSESRFRELQKLQKWVSEAFTIYQTQLTLAKQTQAKVNKITHQNKLLKNQITHIKSMHEYFLQKYNNMKKQIKKKNSQSEKKIKKSIKLAKQRINQICQQIDHLKQDIKEQKQIQKEYFKKKFGSQNKVPSFFSTPYPYPMPQYHPNFYLHAQSQGYPPYLCSFGPQGQTMIPNQFPNTNRFSSRPQINQSQTVPIGEIRRTTSLQYATPQFITKKNSLLQTQSYYNNKNIAPNQIIQALTNHLGLINHPSHSSSPSLGNIDFCNEGESNIQRSKRSIKWENNGQEKEVLNMLGNQKNKNHKLDKRKLTLSQDICQDLQQNILYSPTNNVQTPEFDLRLNKNLKQKNLSLQEIQEQYTSQKSNTSTPQKRDSNKRFLPMQQSKIKIQVDQSMSSMSRFSLDKKKKHDNSIKQSTVKIQLIQDDSKEGTGGQNSTDKDQSYHNVRQKSPTMQNIKIEELSSQNLLKYTQDIHSSEILQKKLPPPPRIPLEKKLRKVTQQQSDLFDSHGDPKMKKPVKAQKNKNERTQTQQSIQVKEVVLDKQNLKQSISASVIFGQRQMQSKTSPSNKKEVQKQKKLTQQDEDDDFLTVNLLAVSKISKQKQLSEKGFTTISDSESEIINQGHRSYNAKTDSKRKKIEKIVEEENGDFFDSDQQKRQQNTRRCRKNSGSRFSLVSQPKLNEKD